MTKLKIDINFNSSCVLATKDITGFGGSEGFIPEAGSPSVEGEYKISDGYFINAIIYNRYNCDAVVLNPNDEYIHIESADVSTTYANNFPEQYHTLKQDGVYTFKRLFVISKDYYLANIGSITKTPIYYDPVENEFVKVGSTNTILTLTELVDAINTNTSGSVVVYKFISTCYLNKCLYLLQSEILERGLNVCNSKQDTYRNQRDYILMTLNVINYLKEDGHLTEVQRVIESSNTCGLICKQIGSTSNTDCGCG